MIPTRLGTKFKDGVVAGFNRNTGSVLVFANSLTHVPRFKHQDFETVKTTSLEEFPPGYTWPTQHDFESLSVTSPLSLSTTFVYILPAILNFNYRYPVDRYLYLLTCSHSIIRNEVRYCLCSIDLPHIEHNIYVNYGFYNHNCNGGHLIPVLYINGVNCNTV